MPHAAAAPESAEAAKGLAVLVAVVEPAAVADAEAARGETASATTAIVAKVRQRRHREPEVGHCRV